MLLLIPVLAVVLWLLVRAPMAPVPAAAAETPEQEIALSDEMVEIDWEIPPAYQPTGRDPMQLAPPAFLEVEAPEPQARVGVNLTLRGILYSEDGPLAMIGSALVQEGQRVSGATVIKIDRDSVEFEMEGRRWRQTVSERPARSEQDTP
jgi:hypothetical protein